MSVLDLIDDCIRDWVVLHLEDGDELDAEAVDPKGHPLTDDLLVRLREHKSQLIAYLKFEVEADRMVLASTWRIAALWQQRRVELESGNWSVVWDQTEADLKAAYDEADLGAVVLVLAQREAVIGAMTTPPTERKVSDD